jgi:hypothetical protein
LSSCVVLWKLSSAVLLCSARRAVRAAATGPLVATLAAVLVAALPVLALVLGRQLAPLVAAAGADPLLAKVFAASLVAPAFAVGLAVGALLPGDRALGPQLLPSPVTRSVRFAGLTLLPLAAIVAPLTAIALVGAAAASAEAPAGRWLAGAIVSVFLAAAAVGAALAAAGAAALGRARFAPLPAAAVAVWFGAGAAQGVPLLGVGAWLSAATTGDVRGALAAGTVGVIVVLSAVAIWAAASGTETGRGSRGQVRVAAPLPQGARRAVVVAFIARLARQGQLRRHVIVAAVVASAGAALLRVVGAGEMAASYLPFTAALVAAAAVPPAAVALRRDAEWLLRACPVPRRALARAGATAGVAAAAATIVFVVAVAAPIAALDPGAWPIAETSAATVIAAAVIGGALVPWRPDRVVEQTASYVVVGALAAAGSYALSRSAAGAAELGVPEALFAAVAANAAVVGAVACAGVIER